MILNELISVVDCCDILTTADSCIHRQIISHWQSALQIDSLALVNEISESQYTAAHLYYVETLSSLKLCSNIQEQIEILREFGTEIISDMTLKQICFTSRELVLILFSFCDLVVSSPEIQTKPIKSYYNHKQILETQIQQRLELFHGVLHVSPPPSLSSFSPLPSPPSLNHRSHHETLGFFFFIFLK
jgi:hypothetical protein